MSNSVFPPIDEDQQHAMMLEPSSRSVVIAGAGSGKCLGKGTVVRLFDGTTKLVEEIVPGDLLMGPDSNSREVLTIAQGIDHLFRIHPTKGNSWVCNLPHMLTLVQSVSGEVFDIALIDYLSNCKSKKLRDAKLFRVGVDYTAEKLPVDPYFVGLWLGNGNFADTTIHTEEPETIDYCEKIARKYGLIATVKRDFRKKKLVRVHLRGTHAKPNPIPKAWLAAYAELGVRKHIHPSLLHNSREVRLQLLAGLLDKDGHYTNGIFEFITKYEVLRDNVLELCRSLGFAAYTSKKIGKIKSTEFEGVYWRITLSGHLDQIPCAVPRNQARPRQQVKNVLRTGFTVKPIGEGEYYGFELSGDGRFLLEDFTVTHNTTVLTARAAFVRKHAVNKDGTVLCVSYTNDAAQEIKDRLERSLNSPTMARAFSSLEARHSGIRQNFWAGTLHSFAKNVIEECVRPSIWYSLPQEDRDRLNGVTLLFELFAQQGGYINLVIDGRRGDDLWSVLVSTDEKLGTAWANQWNRKREQICGVWMARQACADLEMLVPLPIPHANEKDLSRRRWEYFDITDREEHAASSFQTAKESQGGVDYNDMLRMAAAVLRYLPHVREHYRQSLAHVLVDEAQDITFLDYLFLKSLPGFDTGQEEKDIGYTLVGDCRQEIFDFRAGQPELFRMLVANGWQDNLVHLRTNYRSGEAIVTFSSEIAQNEALAMDYEPTEDERPCAAEHALPDSVHWKILNKGTTMEQEMLPIVRASMRDASLSTRVILVRTNYMRRAVEELLDAIVGARTAFAVSTIHSAKGREWDHVLLVGVGRGKFPTRSSFWRSPRENLRSESRLFYVAATRARRRLDILENEDGVFYPAIRGSVK